MNGQLLAMTRQRRGWTQKEAAGRLGVSQPYLAMLETGKRRLTPSLTRKAFRVFRLPASVLPVADRLQGGQLPDNQALAEELCQLGYPGYAYLSTRRPAKNPAEVLLLALAKDDLEARLVEAMPWLLVRYADTLNTNWLVQQARLHNLQNRLGFVVGLARRAVQDHLQLRARPAFLAALEDQLRQSRLAKEDTLCESSMPEAKRRWLAENRPPEAAFWNLFTDWRPQHLRYVS
jgi:transcriptional regulator with XRE-family HTH domain